MPCRHPGNAGSMAERIVVIIVIEAVNELFTLVNTVLEPGVTVDGSSEPGSGVKPAGTC